MRNECNIICDLLPLYAEKMVSEDSAAFVEEHLKNCEKCSAELEHISRPDDIEINVSAEPMKRIKKKMLANKIKTVVFTAIIVLIAAVCVFSMLGSPQYFPYSEDLITLTENADGSVLVEFSPEVTDYSCYTTAYEPDSGKMIYNIEAWNSLLKKEHSNALSFTITPPDEAPLIIYYVQNNGDEDICLAGEEHMKNTGVITLPRLALGYYAIIAAMLFVPLFVLWLMLRKKDRTGRTLEKLMLIPASYIIGHIAVAGLSGASYSFLRSFAFIVLVSLLVYCGILLILNVIRTKKELKNLVQQ